MFVVCCHVTSSESPYTSPKHGSDQQWPSHVENYSLPLSLPLSPSLSLPSSLPLSPSLSISLSLSLSLSRSLSPVLHLSLSPPLSLPCSKLSLEKPTTP